MRLKKAWGGLSMRKYNRIRIYTALLLNDAREEEDAPEDSNNVPDDWEDYEIENMEYEYEPEYDLEYDLEDDGHYDFEEIRIPIRVGFYTEKILRNDTGDSFGWEYVIAIDGDDGDYFEARECIGAEPNSDDVWAQTRTYRSSMTLQEAEEAGWTKFVY